MSADLTPIISLIADMIARKCNWFFTLSGITMSVGQFFQGAFILGLAIAFLVHMSGGFASAFFGRFGD